MHFGLSAGKEERQRGGKSIHNFRESNGNQRNGTRTCSTKRRHLLTKHQWKQYTIYRLISIIWLERVSNSSSSIFEFLVAVAAKLCERICDRCDKTDRVILPLISLPNQRYVLISWVFYLQVAAEVLQKKRVKRRSDWDVFVVNIQDEKARVDQMFMQKERSLRELYDEREQNLKCWCGLHLMLYYAFKIPLLEIAINDD